MTVTSLRAVDILTCDHAELVDALTSVGMASPAQPLPSAVLIEGRDSDLIVSMTSWDTAVSVRIRDATQASGSILVDHHELRKILAAVVKGRGKSENRGLQVTISAVDPALPVLQLLGYTLPLTALPADSFHRWQTTLPTVAQLDRDQFIRGITRVLKAASTDETLPKLCGVKIDVTAGAITLAGTDRFRLAIAPIPALTIRTETTRGGAVMPCRLLGAIAKRFTADRVQIGWTRQDAEATVSFTCGHLTVVTRSITDEFISFREAAQTTSTGTVVVDRARLLADLHRADAICAAKQEPRGQVDLVIDPVQVGAVPVLLDRASEVTAPGLPAGVDGIDDTLRVRFRTAYLVDAVSSFDEQRITLHLNGTTNAMTVTDTPGGLANSAAYRHLVMPIRLPAS